MWDIHNTLPSIVWGKSKLSSTLNVLLSSLIIKQTWNWLVRENNQNLCLHIMRTPPPIYERVRDPTCSRGSEIEREHAIMKAFWPSDELKCLGSFTEFFQDDENRCLVNKSLPCPIDRSKQVICDNHLLWSRLQILIPLGS